jgi:DNA-binding XRE family transcriptional regulator
MVIPPLPSPDAGGNYPATETLRAILAQKIIRGREAAGWTQAEMAARTGVRQETISRQGRGKHAPNVRTVDKIDRALREAGA